MGLLNRVGGALRQWGGCLLARLGWGQGRMSYCYFPRFSGETDLADAYHRACWYLPYHPKACIQVVLPVAYRRPLTDPPLRPAYFGAVPSGGRHLQIKTGWLSFVQALWGARTVLVWRVEQRPGTAVSWEPWPIRWLRRFSKHIVYVDPRLSGFPDRTHQEFLNYSRLLWQALPQAEQRRVVRQQYTAFRSVAQRLRQQAIHRCYVFGNGPGLERVKTLSLEPGVRIACNTVVADAELLALTRPDFVAAVDPESHYGPSRYAERFREDFRREALVYGFWGVFSLESAYPLLVHDPTWAEAAIFVPSGGRLHFNLLRTFCLPGLFGVLGSAMLPLAATFAQTTFLVGCDGIAPQSHERKIWAYAPQAQYWSLLRDRFRCHPSLRNTPAGHCYQWHAAAVQKTVTIGAQSHGKRYVALTPTHLPVSADGMSEE